MKIKLFISCLLMLLIGQSACKKFLDVKPQTSLSQEEIFSSEAGFQQALTGIYSQLASRNLYGDYLTMSFVSALSQDYANMSTTSAFTGAGALNYTNSVTEAQISQIWNAAFTAIAGINKIVTASSTSQSNLNNDAYARIRGEALGLRALLHLDLLRLFGPEYLAGQNTIAIPYRTTVDDEPGRPLTSAQVMNNILTDLAEAAGLLKATDLITSGTAANLADRRIKMNYFAIKSLEARARLYKDDKPGAYAAALEVVNSTKFPFSTSSAISAAAASRDRLYVPEQVFMLRVRDIKNWTDGGGTYFRAGVPATNYLTLSDANFKSLYETTSGGATDLRYIYRVEVDQNTVFPSKYWQTWVNSTTGGSDLSPNRLDQNVPIIRISELYYILAEAVASNMSEAVGYLNAVRKARGLSNLAATITPQNFEAELLKEYRKELHGEGQLFYYYKRKNAVRMQFQSSAVTLTPQRYILPIPTSERQFNPYYN